MLEEFTEKIQVTFKKLRGLGTINEKNIKQPLRDIKRVLLEADVNYKVVKSLIENVGEKALGKEVIKSIAPGQQIIKIFHDELIAVLGGGTSGFDIRAGRLCTVMTIGLQGSGKTTFCVKLSNHLRKKGKNPAVIAADPYRPAAVKQIEIMGKASNTPVFSRITDDIVSCTLANIEQAKTRGHDAVIVDTAGRMHVDEEMMDELIRLKEKIKPDEILVVADGMTGQDAVKTAQQFREKLDFTGIVLTKLDGDARGGAALSMRAVTGKPIKFIGTGEKFTDLEMFHPDRFASRILGMGDIVSFVEKAQDTVDRENALKLDKKISLEQFTFQDFYNQLQQIKKIGPLEQLMEMMPVGGKALKGIKIDDNQLVRIEAIINSMTKQERVNPKIIEGSRKKRIAKGSGTSVEEINKLLKQFVQMKKMFKQFSRFGLNKFGKLKTLIGGV